MQVNTKSNSATIIHKYFMDVYEYDNAKAPPRRDSETNNELKLLCKSGGSSSGSGNLLKSILKSIN